MNLICRIFTALILSANAYAADWVVQQSPVTSTLRSVWGSSGDNVFAVGDSGKVIRYDGSTWTEIQNLASASDILRGVYVHSETSVFVVGSGGKIFRYNGTQWETMNSNVTDNLRDVWGSSETNIFAVGDWGTIVRYDGTGWTKTIASEEYLWGVWGSSGDNVFAVGNAGVIFRYNGSGWSEIVSSASKPLKAIWGSSGSNIFAVGDSGTLVHNDGSKWTAMNVSTDFGNLSGISGISENDVYAVSSSGKIIHYDGTSWTEMVNPVAKGLWGIWGSPDGDMFAVGDGGTVLFRKGEIAYNLTGKVFTDVVGYVTPVAGATVRLTGNGIDESLVSDNSGKYSFNVPAGTYTLEAGSKYFDKAMQTVTASEGEITEKNIQLGTKYAEIYTQDDVDQAVSEAVSKAVSDERKKYDPSGDGKVGLEEAVHALKTCADEIVLKSEE
jgi:hypothetical protein